MSAGETYSLEEYRILLEIKIFLHAPEGYLISYLDAIYATKMMAHISACLQIYFSLTKYAKNITNKCIEKV